MKPGYKHTPIGLIPQDWELVRLGEISELIMSNVDKKNFPNEKEVRLCNYLDVYENSYIRDGLNFMIATASDAEIEKFLLKKGDVIVTKDSETKEDIGHASAVLQNFDNVLCGYHLALIRPKKNTFNNVFLSTLFNLKEIHKELVNKANGTTRYGLTVGTFENLLIPYPTYPEQSQIANILSTVDDKIGSINERITQTEQLKSGLMQQLLTRGIGHTKFKNSPLGEIPESWEVGTLGTIAEILMGQSPPGDTYNTEKDGMPMLNGPTEFTKKFPIPVQYTTTKTKVSKAGDILFCVRGSSTGRMNISDQEYCIGRGLAAIRSNSNSNTQFIYFLLLTLAEEILRRAKDMGSTFPNVNSVELNKFPTPIPPIEEQNEISRILLAVDDKLEVLQDKKTQFEQLKKGLMQQILTGRIRVKLN